jgi:hypothetical protein
MDFQQLLQSQPARPTRLAQRFAMRPVIASGVPELRRRQIGGLGDAAVSRCAIEAALVVRD